MADQRRVRRARWLSQATLLLGITVGVVSVGRASPVTEAKEAPPKLAAFSRILTGQMPRGGAQPKPSFTGSRVLLQTGPTTWWTVDRARDGSATGASQICRDESGQLLASGCREASLSADGSTSAFVAADPLGKSGTNGVYLFNALTGRRGPRAGNAGVPPPGGSPTDPPPPTDPQAPDPGRPIAFVSNVGPDGDPSPSSRVYRRQEPGIGKVGGIECISCVQEGPPTSLPATDGIGSAFGGIASAAFGSATGIVGDSCVFLRADNYALWTDSSGEAIAYGFTMGYSCLTRSFSTEVVDVHGYVISNPRAQRSVAVFTGGPIHDIQGDESGLRFVVHGPSQITNPFGINAFIGNTIGIHDVALGRFTSIAGGNDEALNRPLYASISRDGRHLAYVVEDRSEPCSIENIFECPGEQIDSRIFALSLTGASITPVELQLAASPTAAVLGLKNLSFGYSGREIFVSSRSSLAAGDPEGAGGLGEDVYAVSNPVATTDLLFAGFE